MTTYQPRFVAYANSLGLTPDEAIVKDSKKYPGGKMCGFMLWIQANRKAFKAAHPNAFVGDWISDQDAFTSFLNKP